MDAGVLALWEDSLCEVIGLISQQLQSFWFHVAPEVRKTVFMGEMGTS